ncbi:protein of unknown function [Xenorhabdus doucetiae]|uniref:Uncharacterized protein n=1 Tax=Xenorhabdus doucetiae TaxID=351671 RepID=A0A068QUF3_9GAMM|nr:protein of unknown function [Xenorhabdus doucetiae]
MECGRQINLGKDYNKICGKA